MANVIRAFVAPRSFLRLPILLFAWVLSWGIGLFGVTTQSAMAGVPQFRVASVSPKPNTTGADLSTPITISFNDRIDVASLRGLNFQVMGRWSGPCPGKVVITIKGSQIRFMPSRPFSAGEMVTVMLSGRVSSDRGYLLDPFACTFWVGADQGSMEFDLVDVLVPENTPYGAHGGDLDRDGWLDLAVPNENSRTVSVFMNRNGQFDPGVVYDVGNHCSPIEGADFNHDGHVDLAVANIFADDVSVLLGRGDGTFLSDQRVPTIGESPRGLAVLDFNGDGYLDMATANRDGDDISLLENRGFGRFVYLGSVEAGVSNETGLAAVDMNNDGITDLVTVGYLSNEVAVLLGNGRGQFTTSAVRFCGRLPWGLTTGDINGDGHIDVGVVASQDGVANILLGDGTGGVSSPTSYGSGQFPVAIDFGDLNGDGALDLSCSSFDSGLFALYENNGQGQFVNPRFLPAFNTGSCTVLHDFDNDGDLDITAIDEVADLLLLYKQR